MVSVPVSAARDQLPAVLAQSATEAVTLLRHGRPVAVVVSPERYDQLLDAEEELEDVEAFDAAMAEAGVIVSLGHSDADYETSMAAFDAGARGVTHLFNAMSPAAHRGNGLAGAALAHAGFAEVIPDLLHVEAGAILAARRISRHIALT